MRRALLDWLALALVALAVALARPVVDDSLHRVRLARQRAGETPLAARRRLFGAAYITAVEHIREELDADEPYLMVEAGEPAEGNALWLRYELAPRPAIFLGRLDDLWNVAQVRRRLPRKVQWVVLAHPPGKAPELYGRYEFMQYLEKLDAP